MAALGAAGLPAGPSRSRSLKGVVSGLATMKANTALCFLLGGCALALHGLSAGARSGYGRLTGILAGTLMALIALATLIEYHAGWDLGIDELLFRDPDTPREFAPGRMAEGHRMGTPHDGFRARPRVFGTASSGDALDCAYPRGRGRRARRYQHTRPSLRTGVSSSARCLLKWRPSRTPQASWRWGAGSWPPYNRLRRRARTTASLDSPHSCSPLPPVRPGSASFAIVGEEVQETLAQGLGFALQSRITTITTNVALRTGRAEIITSSPNLLKHLRVLVSRPDDAESRTVVQKVGGELFAPRFLRDRHHLARGRRDAEAGGFVTEPAIRGRRLRGPAKAVSYGGTASFSAIAYRSWTAKGRSAPCSRSNRSRN